MWYFDWLLHKDECSNFSTTNCNFEGVILEITIGDVHQFIDHHLIPLDPCKGSVLVKNGGKGLQLLRDVNLAFLVAQLL